MRVLTVRQPWAWAIIHGGKDVENRTRNLAGEYRGTVAIQAGLAYEQHNMAAVAHRLAHGTETPTTLLFGAILGVVDLVDVHHFAECVDVGPFYEDEDGNEVGQQEVSACSVWAEQGEVHHLVLANPRALSRPLAWTGHLGLREVPLGIEAELLRRLS